MTDIATMELGQEELLRSQSRLDALRGRLALEGLSAMLIEHEVDIWYLTGFVGHSTTLVVGPSNASILCDARYEEYLHPWSHGGVHDVLIGPRHTMADRIRGVAGDHDLSTIGFQSEHLSVAALQSLRKELEGIDLVETTGILATLRAIKDPHEVSLIELCITVQGQAIGAPLGQVEDGMPESKLAAIIEYEMRTNGASGPSFEPIIASGSNSSVIHHMPGSKPIEEGMLLVDWGARIDGYCSDLTRTYCLGPMADQMAEIYDIVLEAQGAAIKACCPGADCMEIDAVARDVITSAGFGDSFPHGLGHGLGMEVHEQPNFSVQSGGVVLESGMVMTVEPGIYLPGIGGIRIEDDVLITDDGYRVLSKGIEKSRTASVRELG